MDAGGSTWFWRDGCIGKTRLSALHQCRTCVLPLRFWFGGNLCFHRTPQATCSHACDWQTGQPCVCWAGITGAVFYAIAHLPLATAITLNYTSALFLAALTPLLLHEKPKPILLGAIALGFVGIMLLLEPSFSNQNILAGALGLLSGFGASLAYVHVKQLGKLQEPDWRTVFYFTFISTIASGLWMLFDHFSALRWQDLPLLLGLGVSATIGQLAMTRAYRTGNTLIVASLAYTTVIFATLLGVIFWQESLSTSEYLAMGIIILSGIISANTTPRQD